MMSALSPADSTVAPAPTGPAVAGEGGEAFFLAGCSPNQGLFCPLFDQIVLLTAPADVIVERLAARTTNPYGKRPEEVARVLELQRTIEPLLRRGAGHVVDTRVPLIEVVAAVLRIAGIGV